MQMFSQSNPKCLDLLRALRPLLSQKRAKKVDDAIRIMQLYNRDPAHVSRKAVCLVLGVNRNEMGTNPPDISRKEIQAMQQDAIERVRQMQQRSEQVSAPLC